jgi:hypothetical protein
MVEDTADPVVPYRLRRSTGASFIIWTDTGARWDTGINYYHSHFIQTEFQNCKSQCNWQ